MRNISGTRILIESAYESSVPVKVISHGGVPRNVLADRDNARDAPLSLSLTDASLHENISVDIKR